MSDKPITAKEMDEKLVTWRSEYKKLLVHNFSFTLTHVHLHKFLLMFYFVKDSQSLNINHLKNFWEVNLRYSDVCTKGFSSVQQGRTKWGGRGEGAEFMIYYNSKLISIDQRKGP